MLPPIAGRIVRPPTGGFNGRNGDGRATIAGSTHPTANNTAAPHADALNPSRQTPATIRRNPPRRNRQSYGPDGRSPLRTTFVSWLGMCGADPRRRCSSPGTPPPGSLCGIIKISGFSTFGAKYGSCPRSEPPPPNPTKQGRPEPTARLYARLY